MNQTTRSSAILALAGLGSALISVTVNSLGDFEVFFVGFAFGVALASYFVVYEEYRNWAKLGGFICSCTAAYPAAFLIAFWLETIPPHDGSSMSSAKLDIPMSVFFGAGFVGAMIVFSAGVFLFGSRSVGWKSIAQVLLYSIGGGTLGAVGGAADGILTSGTYHQMRLLFLVWQPGAAVLLGLLLRQQRTTLVSTFTLLSPSRSSTIRVRQIVSIIFFASVLGFLGLLVTRTIQSKRAVARRNAAYKQAIAEAPPIGNLPTVKAVPPEQALILREIGGLFPATPLSITSATVPPAKIYSVGYTATKDPDPLSMSRIVAAEVTDWPNAEWANYRIKYPRLDIFLADDSVHLTRMTKFGQTVVQDTRMRYPNGEGRLCFLWPSSTLVISVCYETPQVNEEFIRQYLAKYPSSL